MFRSMNHSPSNTCTKHYCDRTILVQVTVKDVVACFVFCDMVYITVTILVQVTVKDVVACFVFCDMVYITVQMPSSDTLHVCNACKF